LSQVESKIKDNVAFWKHMRKEKANSGMFTKDPVIYANPHPEEGEQSYEDLQGMHQPTPSTQDLRKREQELRNQQRT